MLILIIDLPQILLDLCKKNANYYSKKLSNGIVMVFQEY